MVSAELIHNPYLLETIARFNGRSPKVNSAIERFEGKPLVEWVDEVPQTFRDEMNGLDFDLDFKGTESDYQRVIKAFSEQGIDVVDMSSHVPQGPTSKSVHRYDVRLALKGTFEDVNEKRREILQLLSWFASHRNHLFDYDSFLAANSEALDSSVPYIIVNENPIQLELPFVSAETVDSAQYDLASTELTDTPILFMINPRNSARFRSELLYVLARPDTEQGQLFFCIHPSMNRERSIRVISDLGVKEPQIVEAPDDPKVIQYLEDYPSMRFVRKAVEILRTTESMIADELEILSTKSAATNADRLKQISKLDSEMESLKNAKQLVRTVSPDECKYGIDGISSQFENHILKWRNKKTGVTGQEQIWKAAGEFDFDLRGWVSDAEAGLNAIMQSEQQRLERDLLERYSFGKVPTFTPRVERPAFHGTITIPNVIDALISQTGTEQASPKNDLFGFFGAAGNSDDEIEIVEVASYDVWRTTVRSMLMPSLDKAIEACRQDLTDYRVSLVETYSNQLDALISLLLQKKESVTAMLSDEERTLEEDKDWLTEFEDRLLAIERN